MDDKDLNRDVVLSLRTSQAARDNLRDVARLKSQSLGVKLTTAQALEMVLGEEKKRLTEQLGMNDGSK